MEPNRNGCAEQELEVIVDEAGDTPLDTSAGTFTGPAIAGLLDAGIDVTLHSSAARLRGVIHSHDPKNVFLTLAQVAAWNDPARRLAFARVLLASKIAGQRQLVHRHARDHGSALCEDATARLAVLERKVLVEDDLDAADAASSSARTSSSARRTARCA